MPTCKAVVCGINNYGGPPNDLPSCVNDARAVADVLQRRYGCSEIHTLFDGQATIANVERELEWLVRGARPDDRRVFYYSGHGFTKLIDEVMREFLVLVDDRGKPVLWEDDRLVAITQPMPSGVLTCMLDSCFSGGLFKWVFDPTDSTAEAAQIKVYQPPAEEQQKSFPVSEGDGRQKVRGYRQFARMPHTSNAVVAKALGVDSSSSWIAPAAPAKALSDDTESGQPELNGLLISACLETETAAASTSRTKGLSAFTHSLLEILSGGADGWSARRVFDEAAASLKALGFRQTPMCLESQSGQLANRTFITMKENTMAATETVTALSAPPVNGEISEKAVQSALFAAFTEALPAIIAAVQGRQKEIAIEGNIVEADGGSTADDDASEKFIGLIASTIGPIVAREVVPEVVRFAKRQLGGKKPAHKALQLGVESSSHEIEKRLLPDLFQMAVTAAPTVLSVLRQHATRP